MIKIGLKPQGWIINLYNISDIQSLRLSPSLCAYSYDPNHKTIRKGSNGLGLFAVLVIIKNISHVDGAARLMHWFCQQIERPNQCL